MSDNDHHWIYCDHHWIPQRDGEVVCTRCELTLPKIMADEAGAGAADRQHKAIGLDQYPLTIYLSRRPTDDEMCALLQAVRDLDLVNGG